jgi:fatty-acyl-CoA synthase
VDDQTLTRADFLDEVAVWAAAMAQKGIGPSHQVAIVLQNGIDWYLAFWAAVSLGALAVPIDPQVGEWELRNLFSILDIKLCIAVERFRSAEIGRYILDWKADTASNAGVVILDADASNTQATSHERHEVHPSRCRSAHGMAAISRADFLAGVPGMPIPSRSVLPSDWLMLACTSGTTGNPKIIAVPHLGFLRAQMDMAATLSLSEHDRVLLGMPLYHQGGFGMGLQALVAGGQAIYLSGFQPRRYLTCLETQRVTVAQLSATLAKLLLTDPDFNAFDLSSVRLYYFAGEVLPDALAAEFWQLRHTRVVNVIGSTETATMVMWDSQRDSQRSASEFQALPFTAVQVAAAGDSAANLWVSTDALLCEYYANEAETGRRTALRDGRRWFDTQDLALVLPDGYIRFVGRAKRVIKRGPNLIHPEELEAFLLTHPAVAAVAVVREEHELFGESILAWVQPSAGSALSRGDLLAFCRGKIAAYKVPDRIVITEQLPIEIGKIQYKRIPPTCSR